MRAAVIGLLIAVCFCSAGCSTIEHTSAQGKLVSVDATSDEGALIGSFKKGDTISVRYVSGQWTVDKGNGNCPMRSPDERITTDADPALKQWQVNHMGEIYHNDFGEFAVIPYDTISKPFSYTFRTDGNAYLRIHDQVRQDNDGSVVYRVIKQ